MGTLPPDGGAPPPPTGPPPGPPPGGPPPSGPPPGGLPPPGPPPSGDGGSGVDPKIANVISYLVSIVGGVIFYLIEKRDTEVRFHAVQSVLFHGSLLILTSILWLIPIFGWILNVFLYLAWFGGSIYLAIQGYNQKHIKLPVIGDISEEWASKTM